MSRHRIAALGVLLGMASAAALATFCCASSAAVVSVEPTALAVLALALALPMLDSALFGSSVRPEAAGVVVGVVAGFLWRQALESPQLAQGAGRVAATAAVISLALPAWRWFRSRRQSV